MSRNSYKIKEIFGPTIQGEGSMSGTPCHFIRFSGCNMWDGRQETRADSQCPYCDTDFYGGDVLDIPQIIERLNALGKVSWVTISGGEPLLQLDIELRNALWMAGYKIMVETNGTKALPFDVDHLTVSPKVDPSKIKLLYADDIKLLYPHPTLTPEMFKDYPADNFYLQPIDDDNKRWNIAKALEWMFKGETKWKLSIQVHKTLSLK